MVSKYKVIILLICPKKIWKTELIGFYSFPAMSDSFLVAIY